MKNTKTPFGLEPERSDDAPSENASFEVGKHLVLRICRMACAETDDLVALVRQLKEQAAGLATGSTIDHEQRRLANPRLRTTYRHERTRALKAHEISLLEQIAKGLTPLVEAALKLEVVQAELAATEELEAAYQAAKVERQRTGIFAGVATCLNELYSDYGVTHWHWECAGPEQLEVIASILLRRDRSPGSER